MTDKFKNSTAYQEGLWAGQGMAKDISKTTYGSLEQAIAVKKVIVQKFEADFGFSREDEEPDWNHAYNAGMLDALEENYASNQ